MSSFSVQVKETEATIDQTDDLEADRMVSIVEYELNNLFV